MNSIMSAAIVAVLLAGSASGQIGPVADMGLLPGDRGVAPATNSQQDHAVARGGDQTLVVWSDYRGRGSGSQTVQSDGDILGIRLDGTGTPIDAAPFMIAGGMGLQQRPRVAWNGENWLVLFTSQDPSGGYFEDLLRAVRVSPAGAVLDAPPLAFPPSGFTPDTIGLNLAGQAGQWLVTRCIYHSDGYGTFLAGQRIGGNGQLLDAQPVMLNDWIYGGTAIVAGNGEYLVAGPDWNTSSTMRARRIGLNGQPIGGSFVVPGLTIAGSGTGYYVVWLSDFTNLVGSAMSSTGVLQNPAGTPIVTEYSQYHQSALTHDGTNWWVAWGAADVLRTVRISGAGSVLDPGGGVLLPITIGGNINYAYSPVLSARPGGGVNVFWYDARVGLGYDANVFGIPVSAANVAGAERCVSTSTTSQRNAEITRGPGGTSAVAYISEAANDDRVLVQFLDAAGHPSSAEPIEVHRGPTIGRVGIAFNGAVYMLAFDVGASGLTTTSIKGIRMAVDGSMIDAAAFDVMPGSSAAIGALGGDFLVAGTRVGAYPQNIFLMGSRIDGNTAALLDGPGGLLLGGGYVSGAPRVRTDGSQWFVAAHSMWSHDSSQGDAILARVPLSGPPVQAFNPTPVSGGTGDLDIAFSGSKYLLVWRMNSLGNANNSIAGRIMNADGSLTTNAFTIAEAPGRQLRPTVIWDGQSFVVAWDDQRNQSAFFDARTDVYAARVSEGGTVLDPAGFPIVNGPDGECSPAMSVWNGALFIATTRFVTTGGFDSYRIGISRIGAPACAADFNGSGGLSVQDLFEFLAAYFAGEPDADIDGSGSVTVQDVFSFLAAYFAGCP
jgi:hypothetical protein